LERIDEYTEQEELLRRYDEEKNRKKMDKYRKEISQFDTL
jgi:hypothetical protein